ncbi:K02A2.6-like family, partial [Trichomonas vaginalis G3]|uniref:K02A2.6-like family n=1 Tax=Trichomonas vaginalis (strain ATCC PRA-98 / G3) TaxID=412133 RepID=UPI0021E5E0A9
MTNPNKDPYVSKATKKALMVKIFSSTPNAWFMDILENIPRYREDGPPYWLIFVGQNTRYCEAIPLQSKNILDVKTALTIFVDKYHPTKLTSDCESSFKSDDIKNYLRSKNVNQYFIVDQNHSALGVIDSCIKILRDLNQPQGGEANEMSYDDKYRHFSMAKMRQVLNIYNSR